MRSLRIGEEVLGRDHRRLGTVERLVVDEQAHRVTHLVVSGRLLGVGRVSDVDGARLAADLDREDLTGQPAARPELVTEPGGHWRAPGGYSLRDFLAIASALVGQGPYEHVGDVSQALTDNAGQVTSLVLRRPGVLGRRIQLPPDAVAEVVGSAVHVSLTADEVDALPDYEEPE